VKPSVPPPEILATAKQRGILDPLAPPQLSDDLRASFGHAGHAGQHAPLIAEPQARTVATVGSGCRLPGGITDSDGRECSPRISRHSTAHPSGSRPGRHAILDPQQRLLVEAPRRRSRTPTSNGSSY
jgi:hypothetical protein